MSSSSPYKLKIELNRTYLLFLFFTLMYILNNGLLYFKNFDKVREENDWSDQSALALQDSFDYVLVCTAALGSLPLVVAYLESQPRALQQLFSRHVDQRSKRPVWANWVRRSAALYKSISGALPTASFIAVPMRQLLSRNTATLSAFGFAGVSCVGGFFAQEAVLSGADHNKQGWVRSPGLARVLAHALASLYALPNTFMYSWNALTLPVKLGWISQPMLGLLFNPPPQHAAWTDWAEFATAWTLMLIGVHFYAINHVAFQHRIFREIHHPSSDQTVGAQRVFPDNNETRRVENPHRGWARLTGHRVVAIVFKTLVAGTNSYAFQRLDLGWSPWMAALTTVLSGLVGHWQVQAVQFILQDDQIDGCDLDDEAQRGLLQH